MMIKQIFMNEYNCGNRDGQVRGFLKRGCMPARGFILALGGSKKILFASAVISALSFAVLAQSQGATANQSKNEQIVLVDGVRHNQWI